MNESSVTHILLPHSATTQTRDSVVSVSPSSPKKKKDGSGRGMCVRALTHYQSKGCLLTEVLLLEMLG